MTSNAQNFSFKQVHLNDFDSSSNFLSFPRTLNTSTQGTNFYCNPAYSCSCKKGYSPLFDPYTWKRPEEPDDCSRADIRKAYRLGRSFKMSPSLSFLDSFYGEKQGNTIHYLADLQDNGPEEPDLTKYIDADVLGEICKNCRRGRPARAQKVRAYRRL